MLKTILYGHGPMRGGEAVFNPGHEYCLYIGLLVGGKWTTLRDVVPFRQAVPATASSGMLGEEHGMSAPRRLVSIVRGCGGGKAGRDEVGGMAGNRIESVFGDVGAVGGAEVELRPELRSGQPRLQCGPIKAHG